MGKRRIIMFAVVVTMMLALLACSNNTLEKNITAEESDIHAQENDTAQESEVSEECCYRL